MISEKRSFSHNGEILFAMPGNCLTKNELIIRLKKMEYSVDDSFDKDDLVHVYEDAINYDENRIKIFNRLKKDTEYIKERNKYNNSPRNFNSQNTIRNTNNKITANNVPNNGNLTNNRSKSNEKSSNIIIKFLKYLLNHKKLVFETFLVSLFAFAFDNFMKRLERNSYCLRGVYNVIRSLFSPKRIIFGFLLFYMATHILNIVFYYILGLGLISLIYLMSKGTIKEFINFFGS